MKLRKQKNQILIAIYNELWFRYYAISLKLKRMFERST